MRRSDKQLGRPSVPYNDTKAAIKALSNPQPGWIVFAVDTGEFGFYTNSWTWGNLGGGGGAVFVDHRRNTRNFWGSRRRYRRGKHNVHGVAWPVSSCFSAIFLNGQLLAQGVDEGKGRAKSRQRNIHAERTTRCRRYYHSHSPDTLKCYRSGDRLTSLTDLMTPMGCSLVL